jgi:hypothetical protein
MDRTGLHYLQGGNPPHVPALYLGKARIAWWPAGPKPDQTMASRVLLAYEAKGSALSREEVRALRDE